MCVIRYQAATLSSDNDVWDLADYYGQPFIASVQPFRMNIWRKNKNDTLRLSCAGDLKNKLGQEKANIIQLVPHGKMPIQAIGNINLVKYFAIMEISPISSKLWEPIVDSKPRNRTYQNIHSNLNSYCRGLRNTNISRCPTFYEVTMFFDAMNISRSQIISDILGSLRNLSFPDNTIVAVDYSDSILVQLNMKSVASKSPVAFEQLVDRFDSLHNIMIARSDLIAEVSDVLSVPVRVEKIGIHDNMSAIVLEPEHLIDPKYAHLAKSLLL